MKHLIKFLENLQRLPWLKYVLVIVLSVVMIGFVDENSIWNHYRNQKRIAELQTEIHRLKRQLSHDEYQLRMLDRDPKAIEKVARERYFMKEDDEDIFVLSGEQPSYDYDDETFD